MAEPDVVRLVKVTAGWRCEVCGHPAERWTRREVCLPDCHHSTLRVGSAGRPVVRVLTVFQLDRSLSDRHLWNLVAACAPCHLAMSAKYTPGVLRYQLPLLPWPDWLEWRVAGIRRAVNGA